MANLFQRMSTDASVGTTIGTFDAIDTRNANNILHDMAKVIVGHSVSGAQADQTTATATALRFRYVNAGASIAQGECDFLYSSGHGAGIATQSQGFAPGAGSVPAEPLPGPSLGNTTGNYFASQAGIEPADNWSVVAGTLPGAGGPQPRGWDAGGGPPP